MFYFRCKSEVDPLSRERKKICFAVLVHNNIDLVRELLQNIKIFCPNSSTVLFNGGDDPELCKDLGYPVCPGSRKLKYGFLSIYHLEVMDWLECIQFDYDYLINLDSDILFGRKGFEDYIIDSMNDTDYMAVRLEIARDHWVVADTFRKEQEKWKPLFEVEPLYGTFNVAQVFSRNFIQALLNIPQLSLLKKNIEETGTFALEEVVFVNMAKQLGFRFKSYPNEVSNIIRYRPYFSLGDVIHHLNEGDFGYIFHPIKRERYDDARSLMNDLMLREIQKSFNDRKNIPGYIRSIDQVTGVPSILYDFGSYSGPNELLATLKSGLVANWRRLDDNLPWFGPYIFGENNAEASAMIRSSSGHLEAIIRHGQRLAHYWREESGEISWHMSTFFGSNVTGAPIVFENKAKNFDVVAPLVNGGLVHWWRDNGNKDTPWNGPSIVDSKNVVIPVSVQENENEQLVIVAYMGEKLVSYVRDDTGKWSKPLFSYAEENTLSWSGHSEKL